MQFRTLSLIVILLMAVVPAWAGESGFNVIVVVNQSSTNSVQLGNDYCELRGLPPQNLLRMTNWTGGSVNWTPSQFNSFLLTPLLNMVAARGLTNQARIVLLSMDIPYRVTDGYNINSTTSALFYGFKTNGTPVAGYGSCSLPDASSNSFCYAEMPFSEAPPNTAVTNSFMAMLLTDTSFAGAESILRRGVASDSSFPTQNVYLDETSDIARNVRFLAADNAVFENQVVGNYAVARISTDSTAFTNLFGLQTGLQDFSFATNAFLKGSLADNLTSYGGYILDPTYQTTLLAFLEGGAAGSYGTVVEPCNYNQKFPDPVDYFYQARGFSLVEAYYQCVQNPFQGLMVGEPLAAPFARPGAGLWASPTNGAILTGLATLNVAFTSAATNLPLSQADLFVDGTFFATVTNLLPTPGNVLSVALNGDVIDYSIQTNDTIATAVVGLANALNAQTNTQVKAYPVGDRLELQSQAIYVPGGDVPLVAATTAGTATRLTTLLTTPRPAFLDTVATGYHFVDVNGHPGIGDWIQLEVIKTNGTVIDLGVTNSVAGATLGSLVNSLTGLIQSTPALESADGLTVEDVMDYSPDVEFFFYARTPGCAAAQEVVTLNTSTNIVQGQSGTFPLADNLPDLLPKNHLYLHSGANVLAVNYGLDTTKLSDGWHQLAMVAYEGDSVRTQTRMTQNVLVKNTSLAATFAALPAGSNAVLTQPLKFSVTANAPAIARIELFSTGGSVGLVTNQAAANFTLTATNLGFGLHPFYAVVTDATGNTYRTQTLSYRLVPAISLTISGRPPQLSWTTTPGNQYYLQYATNLAGGFQTVATVAATNMVTQWPLTISGAAGFYRVQLAP